jgi:ferredoxin
VSGRLHSRSHADPRNRSDECIDCNACVPECPVDAIFPEGALPENREPFVRINDAYSEGLARVDQLVEELRGDDDGAAGVREPRNPPPDAPGSGSARIEPS